MDKKLIRPGFFRLDGRYEVDAKVKLVGIRPEVFRGDYKSIIHEPLAPPILTPIPVAQLV